MKNYFKTFGLIAVFTILILSSCSDDNEPTASITIEAVGSDLGGDVNGNGGNRTQAFTWTNPSRTAEFNMDITAASGGSFTLTIADADGQVVSTQSLVKGQGDDSKSGVTSAGTSGDWTITVALVNFSGDGSFSISPGN